MRKFSGVPVTIPRQESPGNSFRMGCRQNSNMMVNYGPWKSEKKSVETDVLEMSNIYSNMMLWIEDYTGQRFYVG